MVRHLPEVRHGSLLLILGRVLFAQIATLGISQDLTPKLAGHDTGRGYSERGAETRQGSPVERASGSCLWGPVWASAHELDWSWFFFVLQGVLWGSAQTPSLCCCHCYFPQGVGRLKSRSCGEGLPNTALGRFLASSTGVAPQRLLSQLLSRGCTLSETGPWPWGRFFGRSLPPDLLFLCSEEFALPLTGRLSRIPVPANNSVYCTFSVQNAM